MLLPCDGPLINPRLGRLGWIMVELVRSRRPVALMRKSSSSSTKGVTFSPVSVQWNIGWLGGCDREIKLRIYSCLPAGHWSGQQQCLSTVSLSMCLINLHFMAYSLSHCFFTLVVEGSDIIIVLCNGSCPVSGQEMLFDEGLAFILFLHCLLMGCCIRSTAINEMHQK